MIFKLAYNNIRKTYHIYLVYLFTLSLTIALFYGFTAIGTSQAISMLDAANKMYTQTFTTIIQFTSYFVSFFVLFLMFYASDFFFKVRSQEYFVYKTLGVNRRDLLKLMLSENIIIGAISTVVGLILGIGINQLLNQVLLNYLMIDSKFKLTLDVDALRNTILYFTIILILISIINAQRINKKSIIELKNIQTEIVKKTIPTSVSTFSIIIAIIGLITSYVTGYNSYLDPTKPLFYISIVSGVIGTYLFYYGLINLKNTKFKQSKTKSKPFEVSILNNRLMKNRLSLTVISVSFVLILTTIFASNALISIFSNQEEIPKYDLTIYSMKSSDDNQITNFDLLKKAGYNFEHSAEVHEYNMMKNIDGNDYYLRILDESSFQKLTKMEQQNIDINGDYNYFQGSDYAGNQNNKINNQLLIDEIATTANITINSLEEKITDKYWSNGFLVVSDDKLHDFIQTNNMELTTDSVKWYINYANPTEEELGIKLYEMNIENDNSEIPMSDNYALISKAVEVNGRLFYKVTIIFISLYISFFIIIISLAVLAIQQVMDAIETNGEYKKIRLLGYSNQDIHNLIKKNTNKYFAYPLFLGLVNSCGALLVVNNFIKEQNGESILAVQYNQNTVIICVILVIIYVVYLQLVKKIYYRIVEV